MRGGTTGSLERRPWSDVRRGANASDLLEETTLRRFWQGGKFFLPTALGRHPHSRIVLLSFYRTGASSKRLNTLSDSARHGYGSGKRSTVSHMTVIEFIGKWGGVAGGAERANLGQSINVMCQALGFVDKA
jgi:hypothetical protein